MSGTRLVRRLAALLTLLTTAMISLLAGASSASANVDIPDPPSAGGGTVVVNVPGSDSSGGIEWWGIALIAVGAALVAALLTEVYDTLRQRHDGHLFAHA